MSNKQETLFEEQRRTRNVEKYVKAKSKDGTLSVTIDADLGSSIREYCEIRNTNCTKLIHKILAEKFDKLWDTIYEDMSKEDMIAAIKRLRKKQEVKA
jgi:hypothetical protein